MTDTERERINAICEVAGVTEIDDLSDGFHTFRQLYYQRMMLFSVIVMQNKDRAWKSFRHEGGELCFGGGWFIVGIDTPEGSYTYHYENKYFDLFDCEILDYGKHWDGHTEKDVTRLLSLQFATDMNVGDKISRQAAKERTDKRTETHACDLVSRQAAINALENIGSLDTEADRKYARSVFEALPSAQPDLKPTCNQLATDLISRRDFDKCLEDAEKEAVKNRKYVFASALNTIRGNLRNFPSVQPELPAQFMSDDCISRSELYVKVCNAEKMARDRVLDTPSDSPFPNRLNPAYTRYSAQLDERTQFKHMIADAQSIQPEIIRCKDCKYRNENWRRVSVRWLPCIDVRTGSNWYCGSAERGEQDG